MSFIESKTSKENTMKERVREREREGDGFKFQHPKTFTVYLYYPWEKWKSNCDYFDYNFKHELQLCECVVKFSRLAKTIAGV